MRMSFSTKLQTISGVVALVSMPILYLGAIAENGALEAIGFLMLAFAMLSTPAIKLMARPRRKRVTNY